MAVTNAIPHPRTWGAIKECGGKMWMGERKFQTSLAVSLYKYLIGMH